MNESDSNQKYISVINRNYVINRIMELPGLIAEANAVVIEIQDRLAYENNYFNQLKNEFIALQTISRML